MSLDRTDAPLSFMAICCIAIIAVFVIVLSALLAPDAIKTSLTQGLATICGAALAAFVVMWQVARNAAERLRMKRFEKRQEICVATYEKIVSARTSAHNPFVDLLELTHGLLQQIDSTWRFPDIARNNPGELKYTSKTVLDILRRAADGARGFHEIVENYQIALPGSDVFKLAFSVVGEELRGAWPLFYETVAPFIPNDLIAEPRVEALLKREVPKKSDFEAILEYGTKLQEFGWDLASFAEDFMIEAQNTLLESSFETKAPRRKPTEPKYIVVTTDVVDRLRIEQHFALRREKAKQAFTTTR